jgi:hypothetical protein
VHVERTAYCSRCGILVPCANHGTCRKERKSIKRGHFAAIVDVLVLASLVAACGTPAAPTAEPGAPGGSAEIFSWWTAGDAMALFVTDLDVAAAQAALAQACVDAGACE